MQQNVTFCSPVQVYAKDVALYKLLFLVYDFFRYCQGIHSLLWCWQNKKANYWCRDWKNICFFFIIIHLVQRSQPSLFMSLFLTTVARFSYEDIWVPVYFQQSCDLSSPMIYIGGWFTALTQQRYDWCTADFEIRHWFFTLLLHVLCNLHHINVNNNGVSDYISWTILLLSPWRTYDDPKNLLWSKHVAILD